MTAETGNYGFFDHAFVKGIIIRPYFGQAPVKLDCDIDSVASRPGPVRDRIPQPPSPPGSAGRASLSTAYEFS